MKGNRLIPAIAVLSLGLPISAQNGSLRVTIPLIGGSLEANTPFTAKVKNSLAVPISFCVDFGKTVNSESGQEAAPNPFEIQRWNGRRWDTQLTGTDVGSGETAISVDAHEVKEFRLRINGPGRYRLRLTYLEGENETKCPLPAKQAKTVRSRVLVVQRAARE